MRAWQFPWHTRLLRTGLIALLWIGGCGGVDGGGTGAISQGVVSGLGSVFVNGVRFDDSNAIVRDDTGATVTRSRLALGVMARIEATPTLVVNGAAVATANTIHVTSEIIGPVSAASSTLNTLTVLGQTVQITPATVFESMPGNGLQGFVGNTVEVYGRFDPANARYTATRIEAMPDATPFKLRGLIGSVSTGARTFTLGGLTFDYANVPASDVANVIAGGLVRVTMQATPQAAVFTALSVQSALVVLPDGNHVEVEGRVTSFTSRRSFSVEGIVVDASAARFEEDDVRIGLGVRVSVEGTSAGGVLVARKVEAEDDENSNNSSFELHGTISALNTGLKTFVVRGVTVDYSDPNVNFSGAPVTSLAVGKSVEVHGRLSTDGTAITATEVNLDD